MPSSDVKGASVGTSLQSTGLSLNILTFSTTLKSAWFLFYSCKWDPEDVDPALDCGKKRNCVELEGMYDCRNGHCSKINKVSINSHGRVYGIKLGI